MYVYFYYDIFPNSNNNDSIVQNTNKYNLIVLD
jgi:hypothetical protein